MGILVQDTFTRANQSGWGTASDTLDSWTQGTGGSTPSIVSNKGQLTGATNANVMIANNAAGNRLFYDVEITCDLTHTSLNDSNGVVARYQNSNNYYHATYSNGALTITRVQAGGGTQLASFAFTEVAATAYTIRFKVQGFGTWTNNLFAKVWQTGTSEPVGWQLQLADSGLTAPGQVGLRGKGATTGNIQTYANYTAQDPLAQLPTPAYNTTRVLPYGTTDYIAGGNAPVLLGAQHVTDLQGWGNGPTSRCQMQVNSVEQYFNQFMWAPLDDWVARCNIAGIRMWWCIQGFPTWRITVDPLTGNNVSATLSGTINSGTPITSLPVNALRAGVSIPNGTFTIDAGGANPENVTVTGGPYVTGATSISISSFTPAHAHTSGAICIASTAQLPSAADMAYVAALAAARYNGTAGYGKVDVLQIENEAFDSFGGNNANRDLQGKWLAPVYAAGRAAIKAVYPTVDVISCAVRKTATAAQTHIVNWVTNFLSNVGGPVDGIDFHYYRGGSSAGVDPTVGDANTPSISQELYLIKSTAAILGFANLKVGVGEFGWDYYDDGNGVATTLSGQLTNGTPVTSLPVVALGAAVASGTTIYIDTGTKVETILSTGNAANGATSIPVSYTPGFTHNVGAAIYAQTSVPGMISQSQGWQFTKAVYDAMQAGGGSWALLYNMAWANITVNTAAVPQQSVNNTKSITQILDTIYTYLPAYWLTKQYALQAASMYWNTLSTDGKQLTMSGYSGATMMSGYSGAVTMTETNP